MAYFFVFLFLTLQPFVQHSLPPLNQSPGQRTRQIEAAINSNQPRNTRAKRKPRAQRQTKKMSAFLFDGYNGSIRKKEKKKQLHRPTASADLSGTVKGKAALQAFYRRLSKVTTEGVRSKITKTEHTHRYFFANGNSYTRVMNE